MLKPTGDIISADLDVAIKAAQLGGVELKRLFGTAQSVQEKVSNGKTQGLVTEADLASECAIVGEIRREFPDDSILAEENSVGTQRGGDDLGDRVWIIDPMDGTNNFAHGIPHFAISIGLWVRGVPSVGVIFDPISENWFVSARGQGAWHNGRRVHVSETEQLSRSIVATGFFYDRGKMMDATLLSIGDLFRQQIQGIRRFGAASLDLAWVGIGRFEAFFEYRLEPWDFAAGSLFVAEAGGTATNCQGADLRLQTSSVFASNGRIHAGLLKTIARNWPE